MTNDGNNESAATDVDPAPSRKRAIAKNAARVGLAVVIGLAIAETAFRIRDEGAFPHVNVYVPDPELGARLEPGATEKLRFSNNPVTTLRVNSAGYRGGEWPPPSANEVVVVGDSQVLGLGVEEDETFSAALQSALGAGAVVRNLGVPTYGPPEYNAVVEEALAKRKATTVVYVVNLANDMFEAKRRNRDRHAIWDGWAVRKETAPAKVTPFPGRALLYNRSHAFFAWRKWLHRHEEQDSEQGFASEGTWQDIADAATSAEAEHARATAESARLAQLHQAQVKYAEDRAEEAARALDDAVLRGVPDQELFSDVERDYENPSFLTKSGLFEASRLSPGDIVSISFGESGRDVRVNAEHIRRGAALRIAFEKRARAEAEAKRDKEVLAAFETRDSEARRAAELKAATPRRVVPLSPLTPALREAKASCDRHGARLVVVALPIDVQVSKDEWKKYGVEPVDMEATKVLNADVLVAARAIGAEGFDALPALAAAEPGAFLHGDLHMTPKGHKALGEALARTLAAPRLAIPGEGLPAFRSPPPRQDEWRPDTEIAVRESDPAGCETKKVREWLGVFCRHAPLAAGVVVRAGTEVMAEGVPGGGALLVAPVIAGQDLAATFFYEGSTRDFTIKVPSTPATAEIGFSKPLAARPAPSPTPEMGAFCRCFVEEHPGQSCVAASSVVGVDCARTYAGDCKRLLACSAGDPAAPPACKEGFAPAGAARRCRPLCGKDVPCASGRCTEWQGGQVCM